MFYVGQNVVCVDAAGLTASPLHVGSVYTIHEIVEFTGGVLLEEVDVPEPYVAFRKTRFRPLKDISEDTMNQLRAPLNERSKEVA